MTKRINVRQLTPAAGTTAASDHKGRSASAPTAGGFRGGTLDHLRKHRRRAGRPRCDAPSMSHLPRGVRRCPSGHPDGVRQAAGRARSDLRADRPRAEIALSVRAPVDNGRCP